MRLRMWPLALPFLMERGEPHGESTQQGYLEVPSAGVYVKSFPFSIEIFIEIMIQPHASGPITSSNIERDKVGTVTDFIFLGSKITADGDCSYEIKRCLLLGRKAKTSLDSILKSKDITLLTKVCLVKVMFFSSSHVWM